MNRELTDLVLTFKDKEEIPCLYSYNGIFSDYFKNKQKTSFRFSLVLLCLDYTSEWSQYMFSLSFILLSLISCHLYNKAAVIFTTKLDWLNPQHSFCLSSRWYCLNTGVSALFLSLSSRWYCLNTGVSALFLNLIKIILSKHWYINTFLSLSSRRYCLNTGVTTPFLS